MRAFPATSTSAPFFRYQAELTGLRPGDEYFYRVRVDGEILKSGLRFRTAGPGPFTFLVFGDSGTGGPNQLRLADRMTTGENPALVLHVGDLSQQEGSVAQLDATFFGVCAALLGRTPFYPAPGNHEYYTERAAPYLEAFSPPDSGTPAEDAGRYLARVRFDPVLERHGVQLVLSGHEHTYQRSLPLRDSAPVEPGSGTVYITTGGGGGDLHPVGASPLITVGKSAHHYLRCEIRDSGLRITAIGIDGSEIDKLTLAPRPAISKGAVVNAASFTPALAPGSLISVFGSNLAFEPLPASSMPLPTGSSLGPRSTPNCRMARWDRPPCA